MSAFTHHTSRLGAARSARLLRLHGLFGLLALALTLVGLSPIAAQAVDPATVTVTVTGYDTAGSPLSTRTAVEPAYWSGANWSGYGNDDFATNGIHILTLPPGTWSIAAIPLGDPHYRGTEIGGGDAYGAAPDPNDPNATITLTAGASVNVTIELARKPGGTFVVSQQTNDAGALPTITGQSLWQPQGSYGSTGAPLLPMPQASNTYFAPAGEYYFSYSTDDVRYAQYTGDSMAHAAPGKSFTVTDNQNTNVTVQWIAQGTITGTVVDKATNVPVVGATVTASGRSGSATTDGSGAFSVLAEKYDRIITVTDANHRTLTTQEVGVTPGQSSDIGILKLLPPEAIVHGTLRRWDGSPCRGRVNLIPTDAQGSGWIGTTAATIDTAIDGTWSYSTDVGLYYWANSSSCSGGNRYWYNANGTTLSNPQVITAQKDTPVPLTAPQLSTLTGLVTDAADRPQAGVQVRAVGEGSDSNAVTTRTSDDGRYELKVLPGDYVLRFDTTRTNLSTGNASYPAQGAGLFTATSGKVTVPTVKLPSAPLITGRVVDAAGQAVAHGAVTPYTWESDEGELSWVAGAPQAFAGGEFTVRGQAGVPMTFKFQGGRTTSAFLGGGTSLPGTPDQTNSRTFTTAGGSLPTQTLTAVPSSFGTVAGQTKPWCTNSELPLPAPPSVGPGDDEGGENADPTIIEFPTAFPLRMAGVPYSGVAVVGGSLNLISDAIDPYSSSARITPLGTSLSPELSRTPVTYGFSPDGRQFCMLWADVAINRFNPGTNTFQLLLTSADGADGRNPGDFDITFNYDRVAAAPYATVGYDDGTDNPVSLDGSNTQSALADGGSNALILGKIGSDQAGRYTWQYRNPAAANGSVSGTVYDSDGAPIEGAQVKLCGSTCQTATTGDNGGYSFSELAPGSYTIRVLKTEGVQGSDTDRVFLTSGREWTGWDLYPTMATGSISGTVKYDDDSPGSGLVVRACHRSDDCVRTTTNAQGVYTFTGLRSVTGWSVEVRDPGTGEFTVLTDDSYEGISVAPNLTTTIETVVVSKPSASGQVHGTVVDSDNQPVVGVSVDAYGDEDGASTTTDAAGEFTLVGVPTGEVDLFVDPDSDTLLPEELSLTVSADGVTEAGTITLTAAVLPSEGSEITSSATTEAGVPVVPADEELEFSITGCAGVASPTYTVTPKGGNPKTGALTETSAGKYAATIPAISERGTATITTNVPKACDKPTETAGMTVYIDPSGVITDQWGRTIDGAVATLQRSTTQTGNYTAVPNGSTIMSTTNRTNPMTTKEGHFAWDVVEGWYKVKATASGCTTATSAAMAVPPERLDLVIKMSCTKVAPTATKAPTLTGEAIVGSTITATAATWPAPLTSTGAKVYRNGISTGGSTYTLTSGDVGATFTAVATGKRPDYTQENGTGSVVTFSEVTASSSAGLVGREVARTSATDTPANPAPANPAPANPAPANPAPADPAPVTGSGSSGDLPTSNTPASSSTQPVSKPGAKPAAVTSTTLQVGKVKKGKAKLVVTVVGAATGSITIYDGTKPVATANLVGGKATVKLKKLKKGKHVLKAAYAGATGVTLPSASQPVSIKA